MTYCYFPPSASTTCFRKKKNIFLPSNSAKLLMPFIVISFHSASLENFLPLAVIPFWQISCFLGFPFIKKSIGRRELKDYLKHFHDDRNNITRRWGSDCGVVGCGKNWRGEVQKYEIVKKNGQARRMCEEEIYEQVWAIFVAIYGRGVGDFFIALFYCLKKYFNPFYSSKFFMRLFKNQ